MNTQATKHISTSTSTLSLPVDQATPKTPQIPTLELLEEPSELFLPLSEHFEQSLLEDLRQVKDAGGCFTSPSQQRLLDQSKPAAQTGFKGCSGCLNKLGIDSEIKVNICEAKRPKVGIYSFMRVNGKSVEGLERGGMVKCR